MTTWRTFCAVELPGEVRARLQEHIARLRKEFPDAAASWSRVENIHLTLKFFGNVEMDRIPKISAAERGRQNNFQNFRSTSETQASFRDRAELKSSGSASAIRPTTSQRFKNNSTRRAHPQVFQKKTAPITHT